MVELLDLSNEMLLEIFKHLDLESLGNASMVCTRLKSVALEPKFWRVIEIDNLDMTVKQMIDFLRDRVNPSTTIINLKRREPLEGEAEQITSHKEDSLYFHEFFTFLKYQCPKLESVTLDDNIKILMKI